ncbi:MAG: DM13 domain-containing protein [Pseudomonadota bacterium]
MTLSRRQFAGLTLATVATAALGVAPARAGDTARKGTFSGRQGYNVVGSVQVTKSGGKTQVVLGEDYVFDPAKNPPDIKIGFGNGEKYAKGSKIHDKLTVKSGTASFEVPESIDTDEYSELYIYCEKFTVILAVAPLN